MTHESSSKPHYVLNSNSMWHRPTYRSSRLGSWIGEKGEDPMRSTA